MAPLWWERGRGSSESAINDEIPEKKLRSDEMRRERKRVRQGLNKARESWEQSAWNRQVRVLLLRWRYSKVLSLVTSLRVGTRTSTPQDFVSGKWRPFWFDQLALLFFFQFIPTPRALRINDSSKEVNSYFFLVRAYLYALCRLTTKGREEGIVWDDAGLFAFFYFTLFCMTSKLRRSMYRQNVSLYGPF